MQLCNVTLLFVGKDNASNLRTTVLLLGALVLLPAPHNSFIAYENKNYVLVNKLKT